MPRLAILVLSTLFLATAVTTPAHARDDVGWRWVVAPYVWGPSFSGETSLPDRAPGEDDKEVDAGDIFDALEFAALVRFSGSSEKWRFLADGAYLGLGKRSERDIADLDLDAAFIELAGAYRPNEHLDVLFGARYWDVGYEIDFDNSLLTDIDLDSDWVDPIVGLRVHAPLGESWSFLGRADVGGFDVGSDFTWNAELLFIWHATESFSLALGYRHLAIDETIETRVEDVELDVALSGPEIGFAFRF